MPPACRWINISYKRTERQRQDKKKRRVWLPRESFCAKQAKARNADESAMRKAGANKKRAIFFWLEPKSLVRMSHERRPNSTTTMTERGRARSYGWRRRGNGE